MLIIIHLLILTLSVKQILFRCCNQIRFFRLLIIFRQRLIFINRGGYLLYLRFWLLRFRWNHQLLHLRQQFYRLRFSQRFTYHLLILILSVRQILFRCCNQIRFFRLLIIFRRRLIFINRGEYLLYLKFWLQRFRQNHQLLHLRQQFYRLRFSQRFTYHLLILKLSVRQILFRCCNQIRFFRLLIIFRRRLIFINRGEYLLYLRFWLLRFRQNHQLLHLRQQFYQLKFLQRFTYHLLILILSVRQILFRCCNQIRFFRLLIIFRRRLIFINRGEFLLYLRFWLLRFRWNLQLLRLKQWFYQLKFLQRFTFCLFFQNYIFLYQFFFFNFLIKIKLLQKFKSENFLLKIIYYNKFLKIINIFLRFYKFSDQFFLKYNKLQCKTTSCTDNF